MKKLLLVATIIGLTGLGGNSARADGNILNEAKKAACTLAKQEARGCKKDQKFAANETFKGAKRVARDAKKTCMEAAKTAKLSCTKAKELCNDDYKSARTTCKDTYKDAVDDAKNQKYRTLYGESGGQVLKRGKLIGCTAKYQVVASACNLLLENIK